MNPWQRLYRPLALLSNGIVLGLLGWWAPEGAQLAITGAVLGGLAAGGSGALISGLLGGGGGGGGFIDPGDPANYAFSRLEDLDPLFRGPSFAGDLISRIQGRKVDRQRLKRFLRRPVPLTGAERAAAEGLNQLGAGQLPGGFIGEGIEALQGLFGPTQELVATGFPTDLQGIIDLELRRFNRETVPGLAERFPTLGLQSSGAQNLLGQSAADLGVTLGAQQVALDEAASQRRLAGLGLAPSIFAAPSVFGIEALSGLGEAGAAARARQESARPGARLAQSLGMLTGLETQQRFLLPGFQGPTVGGGGGGLGGIGSLLGPAIGAAAAPALQGALGGIFNAGRNFLGGLFGGGDSGLQLSGPIFNQGFSGAGPTFTGDFGTGTGIAGISDIA